MAGSGTHIRDGALCCSKCGDEYLIRDGIVQMLRHESLAEHVVAEARARDAQASTYDSHLAGRYYREMHPTLREIGEVAGKRIIEHGAGTGRFTCILSKESGPYLASDISLESLCVLATKNVPSNVGLVCADATSFRATDSYFDVALALQVIEHLPSVGIRTGFYSSVKKSLGRNGRFIASAYHQDLRRQLKRSPIDGTHKNGIPYHFFTVSELKRELSVHFGRVVARPIDITLPLSRRLNLSERVEGVISGVCERIPVLNKFGHLILVKAGELSV